MTESQYALDTVEQIYMSFGDNQTDEAIQALNKYAESYHAKKCAKCGHKQFAHFETRCGIMTGVDQ